MCLQHPIEPDHLGSPRKVTDPSRGTALWDWPILGNAFGTAAANDDPDGDGNATTLNLRFPGQHYDAATGLHYNYFRDYDPATGRYVESDPIGLRGGPSTYSYVSNLPLLFKDPRGLDGSNDGEGLYSPSEPLPPPPPPSCPSSDTWDCFWKCVDVTQADEFFLPFQLGVGLHEISKWDRRPAKNWSTARVVETPKLCASVGKQTVGTLISAVTFSYASGASAGCTIVCGRDSCAYSGFE